METLGVEKKPVHSLGKKHNDPPLGMNMRNILQAIGNTPMVPLSSISNGLGGLIYGKCEHMNPGGSVKDRIALSIVDAAEKEGLIKPGDTLVEA